MDALPDPDQPLGLNEDDARIWQDSQKLAEQVQLQWIFAATVALVACLAGGILLMGRAARPAVIEEAVVPVAPATLDPFLTQAAQSTSR